MQALAGWLGLPDVRPPPATPQAVLLELQECREDVATLREGATCAGERAELEAVRRRIAALAAENAELATK